MVDIIKSAELKFSRANNLIKEFHSIVQRWVNSNPFDLIMEKDQKTGACNPLINLHDNFPVEASLVVGDIIHNYRSALDHAAYKIVEHNGGSDKNLKDIYFPFAKELDELKASGKLAILKKLSPGVAHTIVSDIKPYEAGNRTLWALNKLDNIDKHKILITNAQVMKIPTRIIERERNNIIKMPYTLETGWLDSGMQLHGNYEIEQTGNAQFAVIFGKDTYFDGKNIDKIPEEMSKIVKDAIDRLDASL